MTQDQPNRLDDLEAALARFAEITIQNVLRYDEALAGTPASALLRSPYSPSDILR